MSKKVNPTIKSFSPIKYKVLLENVPVTLAQRHGFRLQYISRHQLGILKKSENEDGALECKRINSNIYN